MTQNVSLFCLGGKSLIGAVLMALVAVPAFAKVDVLCVYYPHWHRYAKGDEWFGAEKWKQGEWCFVKDAKVRFEGQKQPLVPYAGYLDESNPKDMEKDIALAANAGIDVFLYDYYYYNGQVTQEDALEKGFLGASNRNRMKFALMWCYHERKDQFRPELGKERRMLMSLAHTREEFLGLIDLSIARYFPRNEYYRKDGKLFFSIYNFPYLFKNRGEDAARLRAELDEARRRVRAAGLGEIHFNAQGSRPGQGELVKACGFDSITTYGFNPSSLPGKEMYALRQAGTWEVDYASSLSYVREAWTKLAQGPLPYIPNVPTGWDSTPRCRPDEPYPWRKNEYPYSMSYRDNTPDAFARYLAEAKAFVEKDPHQPGAVYINGWNEYTEGTYLVPNNFDADGFLRAIAGVFGRKPADEYTYVNPSSKQLFTVPAATYENLAYGKHSKQKVDVWLPKGAKGPVPLLVYIHGGGWSGGAMVDKIIGKQLAAILKRGVAVACVGYRYLRETERGDGIPPVKGCIDDAAAAVAYLKAHAAAWNIDSARIGLAGGSAGACTSLILAYRDNNAFGIKALAPIIPQTSMDPAEMKAWIPNSKYGARAFGYGNFAEWLAHRDDHPEWIAAYSPAALARAIDPARAPRVILRAAKPKDGVLPKDPTHAPAFSWKFAEICAERNLPCDIAPAGDPLQALAEAL